MTRRTSSAAYTRARVDRKTKDSPTSVHGDLFASLPADVRRAVESSFLHERHPAGAQIVREGDEADRYYLIDEGTVEVVAADARGTPIRLARLGPGGGFGEMALLLGGARRATVVAMEDVALRSLDRESFDAVIAAHPALLSGLTEELAVRQASNFLGESSPFAGQPPELLRWLALRMVRVTYAAGDDIVRFGEPGDAFYVLRTGSAEVLGVRDDGSEYPVAELGPGDGFGEQALVSAGPRTATVRAGDHVEALRLSRMDFELVLRRHADRARYLFILARQRARPRRSGDVELVQAPGEAGVYVLKDLRRFHYLRLSEAGLFLWNLMDGEHTVRDLSLAYFERYRRFGVDVVLQTITQLHVAGFVEVPDVDPHLLRELAKLNPLQRALVRAEPWVRRTFAVPDPDRALDVLYGFVFRFLYRLPAQLALAVVAVAGAAIVVAAFVTGHTGSSSTGGFVLFLLAGMEVQVLLHECGHALTTKHFGREVHAVGVGWYLFTPVAFVDTSDMWLENKWRRMAVAAAGPYVNVLLSGAAGCALPFAGGGTRPFLLSFATLGYVMALMNLNPLYELDGYYVLSDWLDIPNLRAKALAFLGTKIWRRRPTTLDRRLVRIFTAYGIAAVLYAWIAAVLLLMGYHRVVQHVVARVLPDALALGLGWALAVLLVILLLTSLWQSLRQRVASPASSS